MIENSVIIIQRFSPGGTDTDVDTARLAALLTLCFLTSQFVTSTLS